MKFHPYKLQGAGIPAEIRGTVVQIHKPETTDEFTALTQEGDPNRCLVMANQQLILDEEREAKAVAESAEVAKLISDGHVHKAVEAIQAAATAYRVGSGRKAGTPNVTKVKAAAIDTGKQKLAAMTPEARAKALKVLESLGMDAVLVA